MCFSSYLSGGHELQRQLGLMYWELEKLGPCYCEPPAPEIVDEAMALLQQQLEPRDALTPEALARFHGSEVLRRRGREALNSALASCARVAALEASTPAHDAMAFAAARHSIGNISIGDSDGDRHLGVDEAEEFTQSGRMPPIPTLDGLRAELAACVSILPQAGGWSPAHAVAFLCHAAHVVEHATTELVPAVGWNALDTVRGVFGVDSSVDALLADAANLLARCGGSRFVLIRALEDQLMHIANEPLDFRQLVLKLVNAFAAEGLTPLRRQIVTTTMAVLATSPKALQRTRACPDWPV